MAFTQKSFGPVSSHGNSDMPSSWTYRTADGKGVVNAPNYFIKKISSLNDGDIINVDAADGKYSAVIIIEDGDVTASERYGFVSPPDGFVVHQKLLGINAIKIGSSYDCSIAPSDLIDLSTYTNIQYVDWTRPDSSGDGSTWALAERNIGTAIDNAIASGLDTRIFVRGGIYPRFQSIAQASVAKNLTVAISLEAVHGRVTTGPFDNLTYTKTVGKNFVYEASRSAALIAVNLKQLDEDGEFVPILHVGSITECDNNPNTWFTDNSKVYVHADNSGVVTNTSTRIYLGVVGAALYGNEDIYISGFNLEGGQSGALDIRNGTDNTVVLDDTKCNYASGGTISSPLLKSGVAILNCDLFAAFNSSSSYNSSDGFNLHEFSGKVPNGLTVNCRSKNNGLLLPGATSVNGLTVHDGVAHIDIGGVWLGSTGTNAGHVSDSTQVWHFGSTAGKSQGDTINGGSINWGAFGMWAGENEMWLESCVDIGSEIGVYAGPSSVVRVRNHNGTGSKSISVTDY
ncbi:MAG: hypothetical protein HRU18_16755 [Pseudoalteromonas sp.]|uniref:hypothetical protein n=1 Tax=Pseudoalteromonas sp. TaxID=53249 RepID=UPI001E0E1EA3|nr:hypothetical protein [Pseudoalteromonas sp.]NRA79857.1 hypothetical protein [Pseudoalteromonas sp.]